MSVFRAEIHQHPEQQVNNTGPEAVAAARLGVTTTAFGQLAGLRDEYRHTIAMAHREARLQEDRRLAALAASQQMIAREFQPPAPAYATVSQLRPEVVSQPARMQAPEQQAVRSVAGSLEAERSNVLLDFEAAQARKRAAEAQAAPYAPVVESRPADVISLEQARASTADALANPGNEQQDAYLSHLAGEAAPAAPLTVVPEVMPAHDDSDLDPDLIRAQVMTAYRDAA